MESAIFAGGCFWGVEHFMQQIYGVIDVESGYIGGSLNEPTYKDVKSGNTGHAEAVRVMFDPSKVSYETIAKCFFEIHDPCQKDRQGVDIGTQYRSEVFYNSVEQRDITQKLIDILKSKGYNVVTKVTPATNFFPAEEYHQNYTQKHAISEPECHRYIKRF